MMNPETRARHSATILGLTALGMGINPMMPVNHKPLPKLEPRKCVNCDEIHYDPKGFCSAKCYREFKAKHQAPVLANRRKKSKSKRKK